MKAYIPSMAEDDQATSLIPNFYCVEFTMASPYPVYQFKLWCLYPYNMPFLLVKNDSELLPQLKVGTVVPMKYYSDDAQQPIQVRQTEIKQIVNETKGRFRGHYRIELEILEKPSMSRVK